MPWSGGFLSWPAYDYARYRAARTIRTILTSYNKAENPVLWTNENPEQFKLIAFITRARRDPGVAQASPPFKQSVIGYLEQRRRSRWRPR